MWKTTTTYRLWAKIEEHVHRKNETTGSTEDDYKDLEDTEPVSPRYETKKEALDHLARITDVGIGKANYNYNHGERGLYPESPDA